MDYQFGLIGYPIKHSLSPWIHEHFMEQTNIKGTYRIFEIDTENDFSKEMDKLKEIGLYGFNVTVPYKEKIIAFLDDTDSQAKQMGAVNTVLCRDGRWIGYNTDGIGYVLSLLNKFPHLKSALNLKILILGAGGAAKGIYYSLLTHGFTDITIANRSVDKAAKIANGNAQTNILSLQEAEYATAQFDLIIQTSSVGMKPHIENTIISLDDLKEGAIVSDIVYQPIMTSFLHQAKIAGAQLHFGHTMLLYQAQHAFEIWTNHKPDASLLDEKLKIVLEG